MLNNLNSISTPEEMKSVNITNEFTEELSSIGPLKLAAREMAK